jgi:hypothetical protein
MGTRGQKTRKCAFLSQQLPKKAPTHLRGRFFFFSAPLAQTQETGIQEGLPAPCTAHGAAPRPGRAFPSGTALTRPHSPAAGASQLLDGEISTCVGAANWLLIATNYRARASVPAPPALLGRSALTSAAIYTPTARPLPLLPSFCVRAPTACRTRVVARCGWGSRSLILE